MYLAHQRMGLGVETPRKCPFALPSVQTTPDDIRTPALNNRFMNSGCKYRLCYSHTSEYLAQTRVCGYHRPNFKALQNFCQNFFYLFRLYWTKVRIVKRITQYYSFIRAFCPVTFQANALSKHDKCEQHKRAVRDNQSRPCLLRADTGTSNQPRGNSTPAVTEGSSIAQGISGVDDCMDLKHWPSNSEVVLLRTVHHVARHDIGNMQVNPSLDLQHMNSVNAISEIWVPRL